MWTYFQQLLCLCFFRILSLVENGRKLSLYSIHSNPLVSHEFCISGRDEYVRIYDSRKLSRSEIPSANNNENSRAGGDSGGGASSSSSANSSTNPLKRFCPHHLQGHKSKPHITAAVYNYSGSEIVASYNDENIYLFDASHSDFADYVKVYEGHLNSATGNIPAHQYFMLYTNRFMCIMFNNVNNNTL